MVFDEWRTCYSTSCPWREVWFSAACKQCIKYNLINLENRMDSLGGSVYKQKLPRRMNKSNGCIVLIFLSPFLNFSPNHRTAAIHFCALVTYSTRSSPTRHRLARGEQGTPCLWQYLSTILVITAL